MKKQAPLAGLLVICFVLIVLGSRRAGADESDPPTRAARVAYAEGSVSLEPGGTQDWIAVPLNRPLTTGDQLWSDQNSRAELELDGSALRVSSGTALSFLNLGDEATQIQLTAGTLVVRVRRLDDNETYEIDTPNLAFSILRPGEYRISVDPSGDTTSIVARSGQGEVTGGGAAYSVREGEYDFFSGMDRLAEDVQSGTPPLDEFEAWSAERDRRWDRSDAARYVSADVVGYEDLDANGSWRSTPDYGYVWYPRVVASGWAPYRFGHWTYIAPWGYTWVDDQPWGFAPFHYGRWVWAGGGWGWVPVPRRSEGAVYVRPIYAPALVAWVGVGAGIAWFALGPREVYVPSYPVSRDYVRNVNISNTVVNTTVVTNVYNTTIVKNETVNVTNIRYVNREVPGAITAISPQAFASAQPVSRNLLKVDQREVAGAPVRAIGPPIVPTKAAVLGPNRVANAKPPAQLQTRAVVARTPPPPPPPAFERRQEAIKNNGGKPLSVTQVRQIAPAGTVRPVSVRIAPPAMPVNTRPAARPAPVPATIPAPMPPSTARPAGRPLEPPPPTGAAVSRPPPIAIHPNELPATAKPASPSVANSVLEREHLQQQQQLHAQQDQERQRIQQQQESEHQQLAKQQADAARRAEAERQQQELERQHQQQTQQLQQQHLQQQRELQAQQEAERQQQEQQAQKEAQRREQEQQTKAATPKDKRPPNKSP